jgi:microcompartment protein CcmK/EutM
MMIGKVIGNVTSTEKIDDYKGYKILVVKPVDKQGNITGKPLLVIDTLQAGIGDTVLVIDEGGSAKMLLNIPDISTIRSVIAGIVDQVDIEKKYLANE